MYQDLLQELKNRHISFKGNYKYNMVNLVSNPKP